MSSTPCGPVDACPVCETDAIDTSISHFDGVCTECGFVIHDHTTTSAPEWLVVRNEDDHTRDADWLATCRVQNATEHRLANAFEDIERLAASLRVPAQLRRDAADIYCEAFLAGTTDGRDRTTMIAACVRLASLQAEYPIPTRRLSESLDIDPGPVHRTCTILCDELDRTPPAPKPADYVPFLAEELSVDDDQRQRSAQLLEATAGAQPLVGKDPGGIAAAALYRAVEALTQADVANAIGVSTETIRNRVAQLRELDTDG